MGDRRTMQPTALVVGLPWLRTGTGKVFEAQMEFFRSIGWNALFVAVPYLPQQTRDDDVWRTFSSCANDLPYFPYVIQTVSHRVHKAKSFGGLRFRKQDKTALDFNYQISNSIPIDAELHNFVRDNNIAIIIGNHVYTTPFCLKLKQLSKQYGNDVQLATVTHDVQAHIMIDNKIRNPWTKRQDNFEHLLSRECLMLSKSDILIHVSEDDQRVFSQKLSSIDHFLALPPVSEKKVDYQFPEEVKGDLLFVGSHHVANLEALQWYFQGVSPWYAKEPSLTIVGNISDLVAGKDAGLWGKRHQHFIGSVPDPTPYYARSRLVIAPMISGRVSPSRPLRRWLTIGRSLGRDPRFEVSRNGRRENMAFASGSSLSTLQTQLSRRFKI